jgi:hypothetical protein
MYVLINVSYNGILSLLHFLFLYKQHLGLSCERLCMAGLDDCSILHPKHLAGNGMGGTQDSISVQNLKLHSFACGSS